MPIEPGKSEEAFRHNVAAEREAGKPEAEAVAIAYSEKRKAGGKDFDPYANLSDAFAAKPCSSLPPGLIVDCTLADMKKQFGP